ncbi:MAG: wax ester/triacylglycerol synthase domain-containing protein [Mycobacterium sp.]
MTGAPIDVEAATLRPQQSDYLSEFSNSMWMLEKDRHLRTTGTLCYLLDRVPDRSLVMDRLDRLSRTIPGFRHRLVPPLLHLATPRWVVDPDFDLSYHLRWIAAPEPKTVDTMMEYTRQSTLSGLDMERPPWTITVVEGLEGGRALVIYKFHHTIMDGAGIKQMWSILFDREREPADLGPMPPAPTARAMSRAVLARDELRRAASQIFGLTWGLGRATVLGAPYALRHPVGAIKAVVRNFAALGHIMKPRLHRFSPIMVERRGWWRFAKFDFDDFPAFHRVAKAAGCTINDAVMAGVGTGIALYHEAHGAPIKQIRTVLAINVRRPNDPPFGNHLSAGIIDMPVSTVVTPELMAEYHKIVLQNREDAIQPLANALGTLMGRFGPAVIRPITTHAEVLISTIPPIAGADIVYFCGAEVLELFGFGPTEGTALCVAMMPYRDRFPVCVNADAAAVPDMDLLLDSLKRGFGQVFKLNLAASA